MISFLYISLHFRSRRSVTSTKYIEVILILDNIEYKWYYNDAGKNATLALTRTQERGLEILNYVDLYYKSMNTRVVVTNLFVFNVKDAFNVTKSGGVTLDGLEAYMRDVLFGEMKLNFDTAQLITYANWGDLAGIAGIGNMCSLGYPRATGAGHGHATPGPPGTPVPRARARRCKMGRRWWQKCRL